jgi:hypothetical protein
MKKIVLLCCVVLALFLLAACNRSNSAQDTAKAMPAAPAVAVKDQAAANNVVVIDQVACAVSGWIVIHTDLDGKPGPVIGYAKVNQGINVNVKVTIDTAKATPKLWAMLHIDAGVVGTYEFPGLDVPVMLNNAIVMTQFTATK